MGGEGGVPGSAYYSAVRQCASPRSNYDGDRERFSRKVFVGGLPPDIDEDEITASFRRFGPLVVDWPHKAESKSYFPPKGYAFLLFQVDKGLSFIAYFQCSLRCWNLHGNMTMTLSGRELCAAADRAVYPGRGQALPLRQLPHHQGQARAGELWLVSWPTVLISDWSRSAPGSWATLTSCWTPRCRSTRGRRSSWAGCPGLWKQVHTDIFSLSSRSSLSSLPVELAMIMDRLYGGVCYAGIDTDPELRYPKGAGRVAFSNQQSYIAAISARFVQLQHGEIDKRVSSSHITVSTARYLQHPHCVQVEVKPYVLDDQLCDECQGGRCGGKFAPFFCANVTCLQVEVQIFLFELKYFLIGEIFFSTTASSAGPPSTAGRAESSTSRWSRRGLTGPGLCPSAGVRQGGFMPSNTHLGCSMPSYSQYCPLPSGGDMQSIPPCLPWAARF